MLRSLTARLALAMAGVALSSALLSGLLVAPLVRSAAEDAVREPLGRQAGFLAEVPEVVGLAQRFGSITERADLQLGRVEPGGERTGLASSLSEEEVSRLLAGDDVSARAEVDGTEMLLEARPTDDGGAVVLGTGADAVSDASDALLRRVVLAIAVGLAAAVAVAWLLASQLGGSLRRTAAAARRLAGGERGVDLPRSTTAEVAEVTAALGSLDAALVTSEGRQREFLLSVSHELRTPLTAVRGYAEGLADGVVPPAETAEVARAMVAETERLERYVGDLLALARLEADDFRVEAEPVDLAALVAATAAAWEARAAARSVVVTAEVTGPVTGVTDPARLRQVVDALVDNAVRVCGPEDVVVLAAARVGDVVRVEVRDSGPGLTPDDAAVAFEPGVLHDRYAARRPGGHGLGLAIVHRLVTRLGGTVTVGTAPEGGACFRIDLPDAAAAPRSR